ncbi:uncharacterized protein SPSK_00853 [Sporothrix schenckii 1099-18]|uniref:SET domain-containing protein n=1 Tax=Sporothrix schenckii 1099-18 TaxID=1397361 RepID=A0A0F2LWB3_SPOSC|nr:uncharacterized protein SPSK_00853 [Sporothrix schenckii 1099-18]KJR81748.1 hypothetical protein SPSK_00853 [Sporothrix schenckii 1099-18]
MSRDVVDIVAARPTGDSKPKRAEEETEQTQTETEAKKERETGSSPTQNLVNSQSSALPESSPPADLQIRLNDDPALGFCVYALRPYRRGERLFEERTALEATHDAHKDGVRNVYERYCQQSPERRRALHGSFPYLAWANGIDAQEAAAARTLVGSLLTSKGRQPVIDNRLTAEDHMRMRPDGGVRPTDAASPTAEKMDGPSTPVVAALRAKAALRGLFKRSASLASLADADDDGVADPADKRARAETLDWFSRYAFRLKPNASFAKPGGNHQAAVYLLTDLINHRCGGFQNCRVSADVGTIAVLALRDIAAGEEVTINYSKDVKDFQCKGECCVKK